MWPPPEKLSLFRHGHRSALYPRRRRARIARSRSPLTWGDKVIGTFNVESPQLNAFEPEDLQFTEIFCRELAFSLHTLELLREEKRAATGQSIEAINREVALPVDEILTAATGILDRWIGVDPEMSDKLWKILSSAVRSSKAFKKSART